MDTRQIQRLSRIGIALSAEKDINKILEMIVDETRALARADGGTLYIVDEQWNILRFEILQNDTLGIRMGGTSGKEVSFPPVPLEVEGKPNHRNVSSYVALTKKAVNIEDIYRAEGFDFSGAQRYDSSTGYRSKSILVIPMLDHEENTIGVLQLLNAKDPETGDVIPFAEDNVEIIASLASQAAVALTNRKLIQDLADLFDAFIKSIATGIDAKSPFTGGHIRRVTVLTMMLARKINQAREGPFANVHFTHDEMEELRIAAWMHDIGKIALPEHVVSKQNKLETPFDRIHLLRTRFDLISQLKAAEIMQKKLELLGPGNHDAAVKELDDELSTALETLREQREFLERANVPREAMSDEDIERLKQISVQSYRLDGEEHPYLTEDEVHHLSVRRGNLTPEEREQIESHALMSIKMLNELPFPQKLIHVPQYAGGHHEKLDGSGYPLGLTAEQLPLQARIIAVADIFEALTARDRPYRKPLSIEVALEILGKMKDANHIDGDIYDLLVSSDLTDEYYEAELVSVVPRK